MQESLKSPNPGFADLVGLKMVFGRQMDIYRDPVVKKITNILTLQGAPSWGQAGTQFRFFSEKPEEWMGALVFNKYWSWILGGFGIGVGTWRICEQIGV